MLVYIRDTSASQLLASEPRERIPPNVVSHFDAYLVCDFPLAPLNVRSIILIFVGTEGTKKERKGRSSFVH